MLDNNNSTVWTPIDKCPRSKKSVDCRLPAVRRTLSFTSGQFFFSKSHDGYMVNNNNSTVWTPIDKCPSSEESADCRQKGGSLQCVERSFLPYYQFLSKTYDGYMVNNNNKWLGKYALTVDSLCT